MLFIEATAVEPDGRITPGDLGLWDDATEAALKPVLAAIRKHSHIAVTMQLVARGPQGVEPRAVGRRPADSRVAKAAGCRTRRRRLPHKAGETPPLALDTAGLIRVREAFVGVGETRGAARYRRTRTARRARLSAASVPVADRQSAHRRIRRLARKPHALSARNLRHRARRVSRRQTGRRARVGDRLGRRRLGHRGHDRVRQRTEEARRATGSTYRRAACRRCRRFRSNPAIRCRSRRR